jgi:hypothetical protein
MLLMLFQQHARNLNNSSMQAMVQSGIAIIFQRTLINLSITSLFLENEKPLFDAIKLAL